MNRCFVSRKHECLGNCLYCFGKWDGYVKFSDIDYFENNTIIYPNCDGNIFDKEFDHILEKIKNNKAQNVIVSISTKFDVSDNLLKKIAELNKLLKEKNSSIKLSVSFSCSSSLSTFEKDTSGYEERIKLVRRINENKIPYITIIKPILPFINFEEYKKIIDDVIPYNRFFVIGDLYVDCNNTFYKKYIENKFEIKKRSVSWNGANGTWYVVENDELKQKIKRYIENNHGLCFDSDKSAIIKLMNIS